MTAASPPEKPGPEKNPYKVAHLATTEEALRAAGAKVSAGHFLGARAFAASVREVTVPKQGKDDVAIVKIETALGLAELRFLPNLTLARDSRLWPLQGRIVLGLAAALTSTLAAGLLWDRYTHRHSWFGTYGLGPQALGAGLVAAVAAGFVALAATQAKSARLTWAWALPLVVVAAGFSTEVYWLRTGLPRSAVAKAALDRGDAVRAASEASAVVATRGHDPVVDDVLDALKYAELHQAKETLLRVNRFAGAWYTVPWKLKALRDIEQLALEEMSTLTASRKAEPLRDLKFIVKPIDEGLADRIADARLTLLLDDCLKDRDLLCAENAFRTDEPDGSAGGRAAGRKRIVEAAEGSIDHFVALAGQAETPSARRDALARAYRAAQCNYRLTANDKKHPLEELLRQYREAQAAELGVPVAALGNVEPKDEPSPAAASSSPGGQVVPTPPASAP
jgi:hypothetical protein